MKAIFEIFKRTMKEYVKDVGSIQNEVYNEAAGANKQMIVEPVVKRPVTINEKIPFGSYVKVTGTTYTLRLLDKAHDPARQYRPGELATNAGRVYLAEAANIGDFASGVWRDVAPETVGPVTIVAGAVVCNGRYHNNISAAGFLVEDDSEIKIG